MCGVDPSLPLLSVFPIMTGKRGLFDRSSFIMELRWRPVDAWNKNRSDMDKTRYYNSYYKGQRQGLTGRNHHVSSNVTSFFVTNVLDSVLLNDLWHACDRIGKFVDVFISNKKSRMGK